MAEIPIDPAHHVSTKSFMRLFPGIPGMHDDEEVISFEEVSNSAGKPKSYTSILASLIPPRRDRPPRYEKMSKHEIVWKAFVGSKKTRAGLERLLKAVNSFDVLSKRNTTLVERLGSFAFPPSDKPQKPDKNEPDIAAKPDIAADLDKEIKILKMEKTELLAEKDVLVLSAIQLPLSVMGGGVGGGYMPSSPAQPTELLELDDSHDTPDTPAKRQKLVDKMMARAP